MLIYYYFLTIQQNITFNHDPGTSDDSGRASERLTTSSVAQRDQDSSRDRLSDVSVTFILLSFITAWGKSIQQRYCFIHIFFSALFYVLLYAYTGKQSMQLRKRIYRKYRKDKSYLFY